MSAMALAFCQGLWFGFLTVDTPYSANIVLFTYNTVQQEKQDNVSLCVVVKIEECIIQC